MRGWEEIGRFGESIKILRRGSMRRLVDNRGKVVIEYRMEN